MPQPARSVAVRPVHDARPKRHDQLAVSRPVHPAERPGVPAPLELLLLGDELEGQVARHAAHGRRGVEQLPEAQHAHGLAQPALDRRDEVLEVAQRARRAARPG